MQVHHSRSEIPSGFTLEGPVSDETTVKLRIALKQNNMDGLIETLYDVSTPSSAKYGQWLSSEEVRLIIDICRVTIEVLPLLGCEFRGSAVGYARCSLAVA